MLLGSLVANVSLATICGASLTKAFTKCSQFKQQFSDEGAAPRHIEAWLRQFDDDVHVDCALTVLQKIRVVGRDDLVRALRKFIDTNPEFRGAWVVPLGTLKDSAAVQTYFAADLMPEHIARCATLDQAAAAAAPPPK